MYNCMAINRLIVNFFLYIKLTVYHKKILKDFFLIRISPSIRKRNEENESI